MPSTAAPGPDEIAECAGAAAHGPAPLRRSAAHRPDFACGRPRSTWACSPSRSSRKARGVPVVNDPAGLAGMVSHKAWLASLVWCAHAWSRWSRAAGPAVIIFAQAQPEGVVIKPARGSGGRDVVVRAEPTMPPALDLAFDQRPAGGRRLRRRAGLPARGGARGEAAGLAGRGRRRWVPEDARAGGVPAQSQARRPARAHGDHPRGVRTGNGARVTHLLVSAAFGSPGSM